LNAEKTLSESSLKGSFTDGYHKGYIKALNQVKDLLEIQKKGGRE